jgi:hypothetical protein
MRRAMILIGLASLALSSCHTVERRPCCLAPAPPMCTFYGVKGFNHATALDKIQTWGFTKHPKCRGSGGAILTHNSATGAVLPAYANWTVDVEPPAGNYPCDTVLDLTFVSPK